MGSEQPSRNRLRSTRTSFLRVERTRFEVDESASGLSAHIFENPTVGVRRSLFWWVEVQARPAMHEGRSVSPRVEFEWFRFPVKDWRDLAGQEYDSSPDDDTGPGVLLVDEHEPVEDHGLRIGCRTGTAFQVGWELIVYSREWYSQGDGSNILVRVRSKLPFRGLFIDVCKPSKTGLVQAEKVAARFIDVEQLDPARLITNEFGVTRILMPPRLA